jgi:hypothetical protein
MQGQTRCDVTQDGLYYWLIRHFCLGTCSSRQKLIVCHEARRLRAYATGHLLVVAHERNNNNNRDQ